MVNRRAAGAPFDYEAPIEEQITCITTEMATLLVHRRLCESNTLRCLCRLVVQKGADIGSVVERCNNPASAINEILAAVDGWRPHELPSSSMCCQSEVRSKLSSAQQGSGSLERTSDYAISFAFADGCAPENTLEALADRPDSAVSDQTVDSSPNEVFGTPVLGFSNLNHSYSGLNLNNSLNPSSPVLRGVLQSPGTPAKAQSNSTIPEHKLE